MFDKEQYWKERNKVKTIKKESPLLKELELALLTKKKKHHKNKKGSGNGAFSNGNKFFNRSILEKSI